MERNILKEYEELTAAERAQVDAMVEAYKNDTAGPSEYTIQATDYDGAGNEHISSRIVNSSRRVVGEDIENYMSRFAPHIAKVNEKLDTAERSKNAQANAMRMDLFEDRWRKGFYNQDNPSGQPPVNINVNAGNNNTEEVKQLKQEISDLKQGMNDMMELLKEKLK